MNTSSIQQLQTSAFFKDLPQDIIQTLLNLGRLCEYSKREIIFHAGIYEEQVYLLLEGEVMVYNLTKHGNKKILFILGKGHLLNHNIVSQRPVSVFCANSGNSAQKFPETDDLSSLSDPSGHDRV